MLDPERTRDFQVSMPNYRTWDDWFIETMAFAKAAGTSPNVFLPAPQSVRDELPAPMPTPPWQK
jgi:hypothetical protein